MNTKFNEEAKEKFAVTGKIGLIATVDPSGMPHITFINTIDTKDDYILTFGEFIHGLSKQYMKSYKKIGFFVMNMEKEWWTGTAEYLRTEVTGEEFDKYNNQKLFRYNTYFGIGKVHYFALKDISDKTALSMGAVAGSAIYAKIAKNFAKKSPAGDVKIKGLTKKLSSKLGDLRFIAYIDGEGYPRILPVIQAALKDDRGRLVIPLSPYAEKLENLDSGVKTAVFLADLSLSTALLEGSFGGIKTFLGKKYAIFDTERVYNSLVPVPGYIYPFDDTKYKEQD